MTFDELVTMYGPMAGVLLAIIGTAIPLAIVIANSRIKVSEARAESQARKDTATAAKDMADATMATAMSNLTIALQKQNESVLSTMASAIDRMAETQQIMNRNAAASEVAMTTQIDAGNTAQAAASTLASSAMDAAQTKILEYFEALKTAIELLTAAIKKDDDVDDEIREDILERLSILEQLLKRKEEKETQDEVIDL